MDEREKNLSGTAITIAVTYTALQLLSNIASLKIGSIFGLAVDMGTFCYPLTFTLRDLAHKALGLKNVTSLVWLSAGICLCSSGYLALCSITPAASGVSPAFNEVFNPMWRIVIASIFAMLISELVDTAVYHLYEKHIKGGLRGRIILSNAVSIPIDNFIFAFGAFAFALPWSEVLEIFFFNLGVKFVVSLIGLPLISHTHRDR